MAPFVSGMRYPRDSREEMDLYTVVRPAALTSGCSRISGAENLRLTSESCRAALKTSNSIAEKSLTPTSSSRVLNTTRKCDIAIRTRLILGGLFNAPRAPHLMRLVPYLAASSIIFWLLCYPETQNQDELTATARVGLNTARSVLTIVFSG